MAFSTPTVNNSNFATGTSVTIPAPANISVGDLLIAQIVYASTGQTITPPAGWSLVRQDANSLTQAIYSKIANSADAAASSFVFGLSFSLSAAGGMIRFNQANQNVITNNGVTSSTVSGAGPIVCTYTNGITPTEANSILIMFLVSNNSNAVVSAPTITTNDPGGWTIPYQLHDSGTTEMAMAYSAQRSQTTDTGNSTSTYSTVGSVPRFAALLAVIPAILISAADTQAVRDVATVNKTTHIASADTQPVTDVATVTDQKNWNTTSKNNATFTTTPKS